MPVRRWMSRRLTAFFSWRHGGTALLLGVLPAWQADSRPAPLPRGDVDGGRAWLSQYQCGACHRIPGVPQAEGTLGPDLAGFGRRSYIAGEVPNRPAQRMQWIMDPPGLVPGTPMPALGVPAERAAAMAAYLGELR